MLHRKPILIKDTYIRGGFVTEAPPVVKNQSYLNCFHFMVSIDKLCSFTKGLFFQHGYLTYYSTYVLENLYVYSLDVYGGKGVSKF